MDIEKRKVLIIGASGALGSELIKDFSANYEVVGTQHGDGTEEQKELDITNSEEVREFIKKEDPQIVLLCSAITNVALCEKDPEMCMHVNYEGVKNVCSSCADRKVVFMSTDAVFSGDKEEYVETDEKDGYTVYGKSKIRAEGEVSKLADHLILRSARFYDLDVEAKKFIPFVIRSLRAGEQIKAPRDTPGNPTLVNDMSKAMLQLVQQDAKGVYHVCGDKVDSLYDTALLIARVFNFDESLIEVKDRDWNSDIRRIGVVLNTNKAKAEGIEMHNLREGLELMKVKEP
tara:strand:- start:1665 stop:2528 length:864 start_codon:yes stop_codon:yes gene_type:complete